MIVSPWFTWAVMPDKPSSMRYKPVVGPPGEQSRATGRLVSSKTYAAAPRPWRWWSRYCLTTAHVACSSEVTVSGCRGCNKRVTVKLYVLGGTLLVADNVSRLVPGCWPGAKESSHAGGACVTARLLLPVTIRGRCRCGNCQLGCIDIEAQAVLAAFSWRRRRR